MRLAILFWAIVVTLAITSCQPCEKKCKFEEGDEVNIIEKSIINNDGMIVDVHRNSDCSCYYTVSHANMFNFITEYKYKEFELKEK